MTARIGRREMGLAMTRGFSFGVNWIMALVFSSVLVASVAGCKDAKVARKDAGADVAGKQDSAALADGASDQAVVHDDGNAQADAPVRGDDIRGTDIASLVEVGAKGPDAGVDKPHMSDDVGPADANATETKLDTGAAVDMARDVPGKLDVAPPFEVNPSPLCQGIFLSGRPETYPVLYREAEDAKAKFESEKARLLTAFSLTESDYQFKTAPITWAADIQKFGGGAISVQGPVDKNTVTSLATAFFADWGAMFLAKDILTTTGGIDCYNKFCKVNFTQDYCGLQVTSPTLEYNGITPVSFYATPIEAVSSISSHFVPMLPIPGTVLMAHEQVRQSVVGISLSYSCPDGIRTIQVAEKDSIAIPSKPMVYIRKSPTIASALEYRLVLAVVVLESFTVYVDAVEGVVIESRPDFNCG
jgi:hypothetical protein